jgi:hypothetical protein
MQVLIFVWFFFLFFPWFWFSSLFFCLLWFCFFFLFLYFFVKPYILCVVRLISLTSYLVGLVDYICWIASSYHPAYDG